MCVSKIAREMSNEPKPESENEQQQKSTKVIKEVTKAKVEPPVKRVRTNQMLLPKVCFQPKIRVQFF